MAPEVWNAGDAFELADDRPLGPMEQYAQVLLMTNEFAFRE